MWREEQFDMIERDELPTEEELREERAETLRELYELGVELDLCESLLSIENPEIREPKVGEVKELAQEWREWDEKLEDGVIDQATYEMDVATHFRRAEAKLASDASILAEGMSMDGFVDVAEDLARTREAAATGDHKLLELNDEVEQMVGLVGSDDAREKADEMLEEGEIGQEAHQIISRKARLGKLKE